jgi:hypothetical protein
MGKKEFLKDNNIDFSKLDPALESSGEIKSKTSVFLNRILHIIKLLLGISLLAFVYSSSTAFLKEFNFVEKPLRAYFWSGVISFLILYLFIYEPARIYEKGQRLLGLIFKFFAPLVRVASYLLPIYTIIIFSLYPLFQLILKHKGQSAAATSYFVFLGGFSITLHLVFSAKSLRSRRGDFLKGNYVFGFSFVYIINMLLVALCLSLILEKFSFIDFSSDAFQTAKDIFKAIFKQIFIPG